MLLSFNEATEVFKYPTRIKVEGVLVYRYYASEQSIFGDLFRALCGVGVMVGSPIDKSKNFVLKYGTSLALPRENMCNWGGQNNPTYHIIASFQGGGASGVKNNQLKKKDERLSAMKVKVTDTSQKAGNSKGSVCALLFQKCETEMKKLNGLMRTS